MNRSFALSPLALTIKQWFPGCIESFVLAILLFICKKCFRVIKLHDWCRYEPGSVQTKVRAILSSSGFVDSSAGVAGPLGVVLERTPFYAESGGQVADTGELAGPSGAIFTVHDTKVGTPSLALLFQSYPYHFNP